MVSDSGNSRQHAADPRQDRSARWPRTKQRERILGLVREQRGVVDAATLAGLTGLHVTTVRFHLDALCNEGQVARTRINRAGVGRPRTGYLAVQGRMDYRSVVEVLAMELGDTVEERRQRAERAGRRWATRILAEQADASEPAEDADALDVQAGFAAAVFEQMGFAPTLGAADGPERTIQLRSCPVKDLALTYPEVSCGIHLGLLRGLTAGTGSSSQVDLEPFITPELCTARIFADD
ncbi:transcriptional regulator [Mycobacterium sp. 1274756.6]|uniref:helix-turn-helix transcriptional regulator n=1 Tax=Mycobacterium sp. 1274756.6 TaxID=1834076 RepID=UPI000A6CDED5|nr:transcriptional regulator [Mycobacterium sp. 1274756.6]